MPSSNFLGLLQAIAGNGHDVSWSRALNNLTLRVEDEFTAGARVVAWSLGRNTAPLLTGLYPLEADAELTAAGRVTVAELLPAQVAAMETAILFTSGTVVDTLVIHTQPPEEMQTAIIFTLASVTAALTTHTQPPEAMQTAIVFTSGEVTDTLVRYTHPGTLEVMSTVSGIVTDATLTQE